MSQQPDARPALPVFYTTDEIAEAFRVTTQTVRNWVSQGRLRSINIGGKIRIPEAAFKEFAESLYGDHD